MKSRISKDPNNHRWLKDETTFGQRILRSQGWTPGSFLGPEDAPHAGLHSAASASHIRVTMKDDAGGLGYRVGGGGDDDIAGMDEVKSIFDRLNGVVESDEAKRERERKKALVYLGQRVGGVMFVRGGLLVQDGLDMVEANEKERVERLEGKGKRKAEDEVEVSKKKKRRDDGEKEERRKGEKRRRKASADGEAADATPSEDEVKPRKSKRDTPAPETPADTEDEPMKNKKRSKSKGADTPPDSDEAPRKSKKSKSETPADSTPDPSKKDKKKEKKERKEKKREKRERREKKEKKERLKAARSSTEDDSDTGTPGSGTPGTPTPTSGPGVRHFHHARRVAAKRSAMSDAAALRQILAI